MTHPTVEYRQFIIETLRSQMENKESRLCRTALEWAARLILVHLQTLLNNSNVPQVICDLPATHMAINNSQVLYSGNLY